MGRNKASSMRRADPKARRHAVIIVAAATVIGLVLIAGPAWYREPLRAWLLDDPAVTASRARLLLAGAGALLVAPLIGFATYAWRLGSRVVAEREFPPRGHAVIRDTNIVSGDAAVAQGRGLRAIAIFLVVASIAITGVLWRVAALLVR